MNENSKHLAVQIFDHLDLTSDVGSALGWIQELFDITDLFDEMFGQIADIFEGLVVTPINTIVQKVKDWFANLLGWRGDTEDSITASEAAAAAALESSVVIQNQVTIIEQQVFSVSSNRPLWEGIDPTAEATFPVALLKREVVGGTSGAQSGGTSHTHGSGSYNTEITNIRVSNTSNSWGFIRCSQTAAFDQLSFRARRDGTFSDLETVVSAYKMELDGGFTYLGRAPFGASLTTAYGWVQVGFQSGINILVEPGEVIALRFSNVHASSVLWVQGIDMGDELPLPGFRPLRLGATSPGISLTSNVPATDMDGYYSRWVPYIQIGRNVGQLDAPIVLYDNFNRGSLGTNYLVRSYGVSTGTLAIDGNRVQWTGTPVLLPGVRTATYLRQLRKPNVAVEVDVSDISSGGVTTHCGAYLFADSNGVNFVGFDIQPSRVGIYTTDSSGPGEVWVERAGVSRSNNEGRWKLQHTHDTKLYQLFKDGALITSWTDNTNIISKEVGKRYSGFYVSQNLLNTSGDIDNFLAYDIAEES